jgi:transcriptional regulator with GAF, ATPase, and Fis domain
VRELENVVERAAILSRGRLLDALEPFGAHSATPVARTPVDPAPVAAAPAGMLADVVRAHIERVLGASRWVIEGPQGAAAVLGLNPSTLRGRMRKLGIRKPR